MSKRKTSDKVIDWLLGLGLVAGVGVFLYSGVKIAYPYADDLINGDSKLTSALELVESKGLKVEWTSDPSVNCGAEMSPVGRGGCFRGETPDTLYVSPLEEVGSYSTVTHIVLHEFAHWEQFTADEPLDECVAEHRAVELGSSDLFISQC